MKSLKTRREFFHTSAAITAFFAIPDMSFPKIINNQPGEANVVNPDGGETYLIGPRRSPVTIKLFKGADKEQSVSLCIEEIAPQTGIPVHKHLNEDEFIFILSGKGVFFVGDKTYEVQAGSSAFVPKNVWHGIKNTDQEILRMQFGYSPAGFEAYFREIGSLKGSEPKNLTVSEFDMIDKKYGIVYKGR